MAAAVVGDHAVGEAERLQVRVPVGRVEAGVPAMRAGRQVQAVDAVAQKLAGDRRQPLLHLRVAVVRDAVIEAGSVARAPVLARRGVPDRVHQGDVVAAHALELVPVDPAPDRHAVPSRRLHRGRQGVIDVQDVGHTVPVLRRRVVRIDAAVIERRHRLRPVVRPAGGVAPVQEGQSRAGQHLEQPVEVVAVDRPVVEPRRIGGIVVVEDQERFGQHGPMVHRPPRSWSGPAGEGVVGRRASGC